jgi:hypothetical protein
LIPIARQYPGAREFVESYRREFPGADLSFQSAAGYAMCQILVEATKRAGSLDGGKIRDRILKLDLNTFYGAFKVDQDGVQIAHRVSRAHPRGTLRFVGAVTGHVTLPDPGGDRGGATGGLDAAAGVGAKPH